MTKDQIEVYLKVLPDWKVVQREGNPRVEKSYPFDDFVGAVKFTNQIADLAEEADHHPEFLISWGQCAVRWWTFDYQRLHENDFIMAARTEKLFQELS